MWWKTKPVDTALRQAKESALKELRDSKERRQEASEIAKESKAFREANHFSERLALVIVNKV